MNIKHTTQTITLPDGSIITLETGKLARQAHGSILVKKGKLALLATVVERTEKPGAFLPLTVDYQEKFSAIGQIPKNFFRRETRLNENEIITSRLIDRSIRPLFHKDYTNAVQVTVSLLSADPNIEPDSLAILATSAALTISPIPHNGPISGIRIGKVNDQLCINPTPSQLSHSPINIMVAGTKEHILMIEGMTSEISEEELLEIIQFAHVTIKTLCEGQEALATQTGIAKNTLEPSTQNETLKEKLHTHLYPPFYAIAQKALAKKQARLKAFTEAQEAILKAQAIEITEENEHFISTVVKEIKRKAIRDHIFSENKRLDGRDPNEIRPIDIQVNTLSSTHGDCLFTRGDTQVWSSLTLGSALDAQNLGGVSKQESKNFITHYNFPAFATGEVKPRRGPARREIGHGNLVWNALKPMLPDNTSYTIRLLCDTLSSDGSSSMGSVVAGALAMMDGGIQLKKPVAGIAMGTIFDSVTQKSIALSDILSEEDACGDADLKVTGTRDGITAFQMDIKTNGLPLTSLKTLLEQARKGRLHILDKMDAVLSQPRPSLKPHTPVIDNLQIKPSMIGNIIGPRGKTIQDLQLKTGATINIEDNGKVTIFAPNKTAAQETMETIQSLIQESEIDKVYKVTIKSIAPYGLFVEFIPGKEGLLHSSEISEEDLNPDLNQLFKIGQEIEAKLIAISKPKNRGEKIRYSLSIKKI